MKFIFWQKFPSMHQLAFLSCLAEDNEVFLVVDSLTDDLRSRKGWNFDLPSNISVILSPSDYKLEELVCSDSIHVLSGFREGRVIKASLHLFKKHDVKFHLLMEPPNGINSVDFSLIVKIYIYRIFFYRFYDLISSVFSISQIGKQFYSKLLPNKLIFEFGYFVDKVNRDSIIRDNKLTFCFIGDLIPTKGLVNFLTLFLPFFSDKEFVFHVVGDGIQKNKIFDLIKKHHLENSFIFHGFVENSKVHDFIAVSDVLVLFSQKKEGWGVVINEAVLLGTYVITSDLTGASCILEDNPTLGVIVNSRASKLAMESTLLHILTNRDQEVANRLARIELSEFILPKNIKKYFLESINFALKEDNTGIPSPPWRKRVYANH